MESEFTNHCIEAILRQVDAVEEEKLIALYSKKLNGV